MLDRPALAPCAAGLRKYDQEVYDAFMASFDTLPLAAVVGRAFFCVHGGLSPELRTLGEIQRLHRFQEIPRSGPMCDLLWSDPFDGEGGMGADVEDGLPGADQPQQVSQETLLYREC